MRLPLFAAGVVMVALSIGCSAPSSPASPTLVPSGGLSTTSSLGNPTEVPFKGRLDGIATIDFDDPPSPFASVHLTGTVNLSHLGRFAVDAPHRVNLATAPLTATGTFEFTAANGDKLTADFTGQGTPTETPGVFSIVETATITGGTGRFAGATGSFTVERMVDFATPLTSGSIEGTISAPGAGKP